MTDTSQIVEVRSATRLNIRTNNFLIYKNELLRNMNTCQVMMYADDTPLVVSDKTLDGLKQNKAYRI